MKFYCIVWDDFDDKAKNDKTALWQEQDPMPPWEWRMKNK